MTVIDVPPVVGPEGGGVEGGVLVGPATLRQIFNDSDAEVLWLIIGAPDKEFESGQIDLKQIYPVEPTQLPPELKGMVWPPKTP